uniref:Uncharacterized protein n=1 Tax=Dunaliella tertiolecta TaxID=3047 RepID=A0A6S8JYI5_DUNTE|mmetsp:Transcript_14623/g.39572  ORF Transcript_14623/g.39572 Transcript_14623/m.39572 type:complete len:180 (+) Transcript_14623:135-674(+)
MMLVFRKGARACTLLLFIWAFLVLLLPSLAAWKRPRYILIIDGGSSGTRSYAFSYTMSQSEPLLPIFQGIPPSAALAKVPRKQGTGMYDRVETQPGMGDLLADPSGKGARPASSSACMWLQASTFFKGPARILGHQRHQRQGTAAAAGMGQGQHPAAPACLHASPPSRHWRSTVALKGE